MWLWLDLLRTPMAAPETRSLRRMRFTWQTLCFASAASVGFFSPAYRAWGRCAVALTASVVIAAVLYTWLYLARKHQADTDYLANLGGIE